jgi:hypothetical protein
MDGLVQNVHDVLHNKNALTDKVDALNDGSFGQGTYTGQCGTVAGVVMRHGYGRMNYENGDWYQGNWVMNSMQGTGCFYYKDKNYGYQGKFDRNCAFEGTFFFGDLRTKIHIKSKNNELSIRNAAFWDFVYTYYEKETSKQKVSQGQKVTALLAELSSLY